VEIIGKDGKKHFLTTDAKSAYERLKKRLKFGRSSGGTSATL